MRGTASVFLVGLLLVSSASSVAGVASAAQTDVSVQSVSTSVDQPAPSESFTLRTTVANLESSSGPVEVTDVYVRKSGSSSDYARIEDVGTISAGSTLTIPLTMSLDDPGEKKLTVRVVVRDSDGDTRRVNYPLYVNVAEPDEAAISFTTPDLVAGQESAVNVSVSNGDNGTLTNARLELSGDADVDNPERVRASIQPGSQVTETYQVTFPDAGEQTLNATLTYKTSQRATRTIDRDIALDVDETNVDAELTATPATVNGSSAIETSLTEYGNVELRDVQIKAISGGEVISRALAQNVPAESTRTVSLDGEAVPAGNVTIVAEYTAAGRDRTSETTIRTNVDAELTATPATANGSSVIRASLTQHGNIDLRDVQVRAISGGEVVSRALAQDVPAEGTRTVTLGGDGIPAGDVTIVAEYAVGGERYDSEATIRYSPQERSEISLTGVDVSRQGSTLTISGDTANVGSTDASSVRLSVVDSPGVTPLPPNQNYFVGAVESSEFGTFELTANASADVESIPVRVNYSAAGQQYSAVTSVDVSRFPADSENGSGQGSSGGSGGAPLVGIGLGLALIVAGGVVYRWRKR